MISRFTCGVRLFTPYISKQKQIPNIHNQFTRLISQTQIFHVAKESEEPDDLLFDLGQTPGEKPSQQRKIKKQKNAEAKPQTKQTQSASVKKSAPRNKKERSFEQLTYFDSSLNLSYVKLPFDHPDFPKLMMLLKSRKKREKNNLLILEGKRLTLDAIDAGLKIKYLFFSSSQNIEAIRDNLNNSIDESTVIIRVPHNDLTFWSTLTTCPGLITIVEKPTDMAQIWKKYKTSLKSKTQNQISASTGAIDKEENVETTDSENDLNPDEVPITIICDQIREPNNLGSIIRTCAAVPCAKIIILKGCTDPWDVKALRGGCGAQFRINIVGPIGWEQVSEHLPAIEDVNVFIANNKVENDDDETFIPFDHHDLERKSKKEKQFQAKLYSEIMFNNCKHIALVIGGETDGVSSYAYEFMKFASTHKKKNSNQLSESNEISTPEDSVVKIPLGNGVESLNAGVATAILLFEMRKQMIGQ